jgi:predicted transcriptional regulator
MKSLLVQLDASTYNALQKVAPAAERKRAEFVRMAIRKAIVEAEENRTRLAYAKQPDTEPVADDWSDVGKW